MPPSNRNWDGVTTVREERGISLNTMFTIDPRFGHLIMILTLGSSVMGAAERVGSEFNHEVFTFQLRRGTGQR